MIATSLQSSNQSRSYTNSTKEERKKDNWKKTRKGKKKKRREKKHTLFTASLDHKPHITQKKLLESVRLARRHLEIKHYQTATPVFQHYSQPIDAASAAFHGTHDAEAYRLPRPTCPGCRRFAAKADDIGWLESLESALLPLSFGGETLSIKRLTRTPGVR
jgi:hypothetical protein